jgi:hypothetical protein
MPRIKMTRTVKVALFFLRVYLIVLLGLIALKFVRVFAGSDNGAKPGQAVTSPARPTTGRALPSS